MRMLVLMAFIYALSSCATTASEDGYIFQNPHSEKYVKVEISANVFELGDKMSSEFNTDYAQISSVAWVLKNRSFFVLALCGNVVVKKEFFVNWKDNIYQLKCSGNELALLIAAAQPAP